jgi:WD40 repeat protein
MAFFFSPLIVLVGHASSVSVVDVSPDGRALLAVGLDAQSRQSICVWDISGLLAGMPVRGWMAVAMSRLS